MIKAVDDLLNRITMYRLVLYYLIGLVGLAIALGAFNLVNYSPTSILVSTILIVAVSWITNKIFSWVFEAPVNTESVYITALISALIVAPIKLPHDVFFLVWVGVISMASKYVLAIGKKHITNPVAIAIVLTNVVIDKSANWWVGNVWMMPFVFLGGILIVRKIRRTDMVFSFIFTVLAISGGVTILNGGVMFGLMDKILLHSSLFFFAFVMLTEPLTTPPNKKMQIAYGSLVGLLFAPQTHIGSLYFTPELALVIGNVFTYLVSPKQKLILKLKENTRLAPDLMDFIFDNKKKLAFTPGQYMEWTLAHHKPDSRGNRRYFTLASSPTEDTLRLGIKFYPNGSTYKQNMEKMDANTPIVAAQLAGDFTLPTDRSRKLVFIAGGIGITPFRSMIKYLLDTKEKRKITLFFANKQPQEIVYKEVFDKAEKEIGIKVVYTLTDKNNIPMDWTGRIGRIDSVMIQQEVPDYKERYFYLSGPRTMVVAYEEVLKSIGIRNDHIVTDYFPGFA